MQVIDASKKFIVSGMYPKIFLQTVDAPTVYHEDIEKQFYIVKDDFRFALGITWFCKLCYMEVWQGENWSTRYKTFVLTELQCKNCGNWFLHPNTMSELTGLKFIWEIHTGCWREA